MCTVLNFFFFVLAYFCSYMSTFYLSTAEAVLQKMDDMEKKRRRRMMEDLGVFHDAEEVDTNLFYCFCISSVFHIGKLCSCNFNLPEITSSKE